MRWLRCCSASRRLPSHSKWDGRLVLAGVALFAKPSAKGVVFVADVTGGFAGLFYDGFLQLVFDVPDQAQALASAAGFFLQAAVAVPAVAFVFKDG